MLDKGASRVRRGEWPSPPAASADETAECLLVGRTQRALILGAREDQDRAREDQDRECTTARSREEGKCRVTRGQPDPGPSLGAEPLSAPSAGLGGTPLGLFPTCEGVGNGG